MALLPLHSLLHLSPTHLSFLKVLHNAVLVMKLHTKKTSMLAEKESSPSTVKSQSVKQLYGTN
jgi:hypothetical protein